MMQVLRQVLVLAALCVASVGAMASGEARDLNGDGVADAYYDSTYNQTWLAQPTFSGIYFNQWVAASLADEAYGAHGWRIPNLFTAPPITYDQCVGGYWQVICSTGPGDSEVSRLSADFGVDPFGWGSGTGSVVVPAGAWAPVWSGPAFSLDLAPVLGKTSAQFVGDTFAFDAPFYLLADGDVGAAITAVPEPATYALLLAGLLGIMWRRRSHQ